MLQTYLINSIDLHNKDEPKTQFSFSIYKKIHINFSQKNCRVFGRLKGNLLSFCVEICFGKFIYIFL